MIAWYGHKRPLLRRFHPNAEDVSTYDWVVETVPGSVAGIQTSDYREYFRKDSARFAAFLVNQVSNDSLTQTEPSFELIFRTLKPAD